jgi:predicted nucleic acid-binding protein
MSRVFWDTNLFIYLFEDYGPLSAAVAELRAKMLDRGDQLLTSTLTLGEILVKPSERNDFELCSKYEQAIASAAIMISFDHKAANVYARLRSKALRSKRTLKAPDAIQLSCAASANADLFVTNDERLHEEKVEGIQFIVPLKRVPI